MSKPVDDSSHSRYQQQALLGEGGFGEVYKAIDTKLERFVAVKLLHKEDFSIMHEAKALARVNSPFVVTIYDVINWDNQPAIVMEFIENAVPLSLDSFRNIEPDNFITFYLQLLKGVSAIHAQGLCHGDIKPSNILIDSNNQVKLTDFGLAQSHGTAAKLNKTNSSQASANTSITLDNKDIANTNVNTSKVYGSWESMTPEALMGKTMTPSGDVFSLGSLLYCAIYGEHPFLVENDPTQTKNNLQHKIKTKNKQAKNEKLAPLASLCQRMIALSPEKRPSIEEILSATFELQNKKSAADSMLITQPLELEPSSQGVKRFFTKKYAAITTFSLAVFAIAIFFLIPAPIKSTLVIPTLIINETISATEKEQSLLERAKILSTLMDDELIDAVLTDPNRRLVPKREWHGVRDWQLVAHNLSVNDILFSEINCREIDSCEVIISLYQSEQNKVVATKKMTVPSDNLLVFSDLIRATTDELINNKKTARKINITEESLKEYAYLQLNRQTLDINNLIDRLENLAEKNPTFSGAFLLLGTVYLRKYDRTNEKKWIKKALDTADRISDSSSGLELLYNINMRSNKFDKAEKIVEQLRQLPGLDPSTIELKHTMILFKQGNKNEAIQHLTKQKKLRRTNNYYHVKSYMLDKIGDYQSVINTTDAWLTMQASNSIAKEYKLRALIHLGQLNKGIALGEEMLSSKVSPHILTDLGLIYLLNGNYHKSILLLDQQLEKSPNNNSALLKLAEAYKVLGNTSKSQKLFEKIIHNSLELELTSWKGFARLAMAYAHLGKTTEALLALQNMSAAALAANAATDGIYYLQSSHIYWLINQPKAALINGKKAHKAGRGIHWFNLPWFAKLSQQLVQAQKDSLNEYD